jgi:cytochrome c oxidase subunit 3
MLMTSFNKLQTRNASLPHPYHLVDVSPWPILISFVVLLGAFIVVSFFTHRYNYGPLVGYLALGSFLIIIIQWFRDIIREAQGGYHTKIVQRGIYISFLLFLVTEVMLFASFFWAFFHSSLAPAVELGSQWPPVGLNAVDTWSLPLFGTCLLVASGFILTVGHHALIQGDKDKAIINIIASIILGVLFTYAQYKEYSFAEFTISDSVFGSVFYMTTGLHFCHVVAGVLFLTVSVIRLYFDNYTSEHHLGLEFAIIYWHLVDIVWLAVYVIFYWWGGA